MRRSYRATSYAADSEIRKCRVPLAGTERHSAAPWPGHSIRADVSVTVLAEAQVKTMISSIPEDALPTVEYTDAVNDEQTSLFSARCHIRGPAGVSML